MITHHAPSVLSVAESYRRNRLSAAFASRLDALILAHSARLWIHGHMHTSFDYNLGDTQIVCNPSGYPDSDQNPEFDPSLVIEI